ncbi:MAG: zeta toxin family protein [Synergistaceae bacterium]|jgi:predicted ABC-type ATPase|nr:zeta toxin family protein [Synergistaceae bacterium]
MPDERYKLPKEDHEYIFRGLLDDMLADTVPQEQPRIVILGGQPGSGKSRLTEIARENVFDNQPVAVINGDDYRAYHPQAENIYRQHDKGFAEMTDPDVRKWTPRLLGAAVKEKRNIIFEATMRNKEPLMSTIEYLKEQGYQIGVMVMAVHEQVSSVRIVNRYEDQKAKGGIARWTPMENHDEAFGNMPQTAEAIERNSPIDSISVYNRAGEEIYRNESAENTFRRPSPGMGAGKAVKEERKRPLSLDERKTIQSKIEDIREKMSNRGANAEFETLKKIFNRGMDMGR